MRCGGWLEFGRLGLWWRGEENNPIGGCDEMDGYTWNRLKSRTKQQGGSGKGQEALPVYCARQCWRRGLGLLNQFLWKPEMSRLIGWPLLVLRIERFLTVFNKMCAKQNGT